MSSITAEDDDKHMDDMQNDGVENLISSMEISSPVTASVELEPTAAVDASAAEKAPTDSESSAEAKPSAEMKDAKVGISSEEVWEQVRQFREELDDTEHRLRILSARVQVLMEREAVSAASDTFNMSDLIEFPGIDLDDALITLDQTAGDAAAEQCSEIDEMLWTGGR